METNTDPTPGHKTTEFYALLVVVAVLTVMMFRSGSSATEVVAIVGIVLAKLGYTASRTAVKTNATPAIVSELVQGEPVDSSLALKPTPPPAS